MKAVLEEERGNLTAELKTLQRGKIESERARKRAEGQLQELTARLAQAEREREEREDRLHKLQVRRSLGHCIKICLLCLNTLDFISTSSQWEIIQ